MSIALHIRESTAQTLLAGRSVDHIPTVLHNIINATGAAIYKISHPIR